MTDADIFCLLGRTEFAVYSNLIVDVTGPVSGASAGFTRMKRQHFIAPAVGDGTAFRRVQRHRHLV